MKPLCFVGVVDDGYQEYLPLFAYFALHAYPDAELILYHAGGRLLAEVREGLDALSDLGSIDARPLAYRYDAAEPQSLKSLRWVLYDEDFARYENVYIGDVDMLIVRQEPSLRAVRVRHSEEIGRPYSNRVRPGRRRSPASPTSSAPRSTFRGSFPGCSGIGSSSAMGRCGYTTRSSSTGCWTNRSVFRPSGRRLCAHITASISAPSTGFASWPSSARGRTTSSASTSSRISMASSRWPGRSAARSSSSGWHASSLLRSVSARYAQGGPALTVQFRNTLSLCDDLLEERARGAG
jgi:hypothetical protein